MSEEQYILEKSVWTDEDYQKMGWHDVPIYAFSFEESESDGPITNVLFDIDYIFKWLHPIKPKIYFGFWIAPCTLIFKDVFGLNISVSNDDWMSSFLEIDDIEMTRSVNPSYKYHTKILLQQGDIEFLCNEMNQVVRSFPIYTEQQSLSDTDRGGISFSKQPVTI